MSPTRPQVPDPGEDLVLEDSHLRPWTQALWRIHRTTGRHPAEWDSLRSYGPLDSMRWDPQRPLGGPVPSHGFEPAVAYTSATIDGAFAEIFQEDRVIQLTSDRALSSWVPARELHLVDLAGSDFAVHNDAAHALPSLENKTLTRRWARAIFEAFGDRIDGLLHNSTMVGDEMIVLFTRAQNSFPSAPGFSRPLTHEIVAEQAAKTANRLKWPMA